MIYYKKVTENNLQIKVAEKNHFNLLKADYRQSNALFYPTLLFRILE